MTELINLLIDFTPLWSLLTIIVSAVWGPAWLAKIQGKNKTSELKVEGDSKVETEYIAGMRDVIKEYRESVNGYKEEVKSLRNEVKQVRSEMIIKDEQHKEVINQYENQLELKDDEIEMLHVSILEKDGIILEKDTQIERYKQENDTLLWEVKELKGDE